jgi:uncharacterized membrane protein HdeD (DUF308 family)
MGIFQVVAGALAVGFAFVATLVSAVTLGNPLLAAESLTLLLAAVLLVGGTFRVVLALVEQFPSWGWVLLNGVITAFLGLAVW